MGALLNFLQFPSHFSRKKMLKRPEGGKENKGFTGKGTGRGGGMQGGLSSEPDRESLLLWIEGVEHPQCVLVRIGVFVRGKTTFIIKIHGAVSLHFIGLDRKELTSSKLLFGGFFGYLGNQERAYMLFAHILSNGQISNIQCWISSFTVESGHVVKRDVGSIR